MLIANTEWGRFAIPESAKDRWPSRVVLDGRRWEPETTQTVCDAAARGGDVVHAGAFFGDALPALSAAVADGCRVYAFEPNPESFGAARQTVEMNGLRNVWLRQAALGPELGTTHLRTSGPDGEPLGPVSRVAVDGVEVEVLTIDSVVGERKVAALHLDVEGWELHALAGAVKTINRGLPTLILEAWRGPEPILTWCKAAVNGATYRVVKEVEGNVIVEVGSA